MAGFRGFTNPETDDYSPFGNQPVDNGDITGGVGSMGGDTSGGFDWGSIMGSLSKYIPGLSDDPTKASFLPAFLSAYQSWQNAGKYGDVAQQAADKYGDPFGQASRDYYKNKLQASYDDPAAVLSDPGHMATINSGIGQVSRADASKGYLGSGNMAVDLTDYTTQENNKFLSQYRKDLQPLTGAQFRPEGGDYLMKGAENEINAKNAALQAMMYPFGRQTTNNYLQNQSSQGGSGTGGGLGSSGPIDWSKYGTSGAAMSAEILKVTGGLGGSAKDIMNGILSGKYQDISPSTRAILEDLAKDPYAGALDLTSLPDNQGYSFGQEPYGPIGMSGFGASTGWTPGGTDLGYGGLDPDIYGIDTALGIGD